jgi:hypothetical protein
MKIHCSDPNDARTRYPLSSSQYPTKSARVLILDSLASRCLRKQVYIPLKLPSLKYLVQSWKWPKRAWHCGTMGGSLNEKKKEKKLLYKKLLVNPKARC